MKTIVIANHKGGSGKSTLTVHLATAAEHAGHGPAVLSDTDPQGTSGDWFNQRKKSGLHTPLYAPLALPELRARIQALSEAGAAYLFIDTAPSIGAVNADLLAVADLILIPLNPTPADLRALVKGLPLVRESGKPFSFVLARVPPGLGEHGRQPPGVLGEPPVRDQVLLAADAVHLAQGRRVPD
ncbi:MAG: ParA family protein, partial [Chromatiaceae bacterium]|nr:ParA family protein [Candidatus Thioaporhodococcus sediminis]